MKLSGDQVKKVAQLANLPLNSSEEELYSEQLSAILEYVEQLEKVPTDDVTPLYNTTGLKNILDDDQTNTSLTQSQALSNAVKSEDNLFVTQGVFDHE